MSEITNNELLEDYKKKLPDMDLNDIYMRSGMAGLIALVLLVLYIGAVYFVIFQFVIFTTPFFVILYSALVTWWTIWVKNDIIFYSKVLYYSFKEVDKRGDLGNGV